MMRQIGKTFPWSDAIGVGQSVSRNGLELSVEQKPKPGIDPDN